MRASTREKILTFRLEFETEEEIAALYNLAGKFLYPHIDLPTSRDVEADILANRLSRELEKYYPVLVEKLTYEEKKRMPTRKLPCDSNTTIPCSADTKSRAYEGLDDDPADDLDFREDDDLY